MTLIIITIISIKGPLIREPNIVVGVAQSLLGLQVTSCKPSPINPGTAYTNTRNRQILDNLIREKVNDVEVLGNDYQLLAYYDDFLNEGK